MAEESSEKEEKSAARRVKGLEPTIQQQSEQLDAAGAYIEALKARFRARERTYRPAPPPKRSLLQRIRGY